MVPVIYSSVKKNDAVVCFSPFQEDEDEEEEEEEGEGGSMVVGEGAGEMVEAEVGDNAEEFDATYNVAEDEEGLDEEAGRDEEDDDDEEEEEEEEDLELEYDYEDEEEEMADYFHVRMPGASWQWRECIHTWSKKLYVFAVIPTVDLAFPPFASTGREDQDVVNSFPAVHGLHPPPSFPSLLTRSYHTRPMHQFPDFDPQPSASSSVGGLPQFHPLFSQHSDPQQQQRQQQAHDTVQPVQAGQGAGQADPQQQQHDASPGMQQLLSSISAVTGASEVIGFGVGGAGAQRTRGTLVV